jgi:cobyrinic acid a,c-diamide synthase
LPTALDALYFGGGYPELFAKQLSENRLMIASIKRAAEDGLPIYAECGGLMYLARKIETKEDASFPMAGVLPIAVQMTDRLVNFGYTEVSFTSDCLIGPAGAKARGHSFHCSRISDVAPVEYAYQARNSMTGREESDGLRVKNVLASYIHLHFLSNREMADAFVKNAELARRRPVSPASKQPEPMHSTRFASDR